MLKFILFISLLIITTICYIYPGAFFGVYFFGALTVFYAMYLICKFLSDERRFNLKIFKKITLILKLFFILWLISFIIIEILINQGKKEDEFSADVLIVLGAGVNYDTVSYSFRSRLDRTYEYLIENPDCIVITTGGLSSEDKYSEGYAGMQYLLYKGIEKERIFYEETSKNTYQNILNAKELLPEDFNGTSAVVSSGYHLFRARKLMELFELDSNALASDLSQEYPFLEIIYNIREYFSVMKHYIFER